MSEQATVPVKTADNGAKDRGVRRVVVGVVTADKCSKTRRVETQRLVKHAKYGKYIKQRTVCYVHDEKDDSHLGDTVEIMECRPLSRTKRWRLVKVVTKAPSRTLSGLEGAVAGSSDKAAGGAMPNSVQANAQ